MREGRGAACCAPTAIVSRGYLLVRVDGKHYGLPLARVLEVGDLGEVLDVPRALAAVRGVTPLRGRLVPLVHLGALLGERPPPAERGRAAVLVQLGAGGGLPQAARHSGPTSRRDAHRHPGMGGREARRRGGRRDRGAPGRGDRGHGATEHREGTGGGIHHRDRGEGRAHRHRAQHGAAVQLEGEAGHRERAPGDSETLMVDSPIRALRAEYDTIARKLDTAAAGPEREAVKRDIVAYFKRVDSLIGELGELKEEIRKLVDRYKQLTSSTAEASAPEFTGTRPAVHADHLGASTFIEKGWSLISL